jgi:hypothetical protein
MKFTEGVRKREKGFAELLQVDTAAVTARRAARFQAVTARRTAQFLGTTATTVEAAAWSLTRCWRRRRRSGAATTEEERDDVVPRRGGEGRADGSDGVDPVAAAKKRE